MLINGRSGQMVHKTVICEFKRVSMSNRQYFSSILEEARLWQQQQGSEGWDYPFDDEWLLPRIRRNELWLGLDGDQPVAAFRVLMEDVPFWGEREQHLPALVCCIAKSCRSGHRK